MWETRRTSQIATEMTKYNSVVLAISETHWTQTGQQRLDMGEMLLYCSHEKESVTHTQAVVLTLSNESRNALIRWESHGSRIIKTSFIQRRRGSQRMLFCVTHPLMTATTTIEISSTRDCNR
ncbi:unnamed protein product [Schistosoma margrebowiei]|uniref:Uncharacterized protein n=1 Tax=Schistosoma margrebowiei TaxID=48269 RepID=A0A183MG40_9TREM|nr:unnamed protein product [Schistosoma margrebowiei]